MRRRTTRTPSDLGIAGGVLPVAAQIGEIAAAAAGGFGEDFVAAVAVDADGGGVDEHLAGARRHGQLARWPRRPGVVTPTRLSWNSGAGFRSFQRWSIGSPARLMTAWWPVKSRASGVCQRSTPGTEPLPERLTPVVAMPFSASKAGRPRPMNPVTPTIATLVGSLAWRRMARIRERVKRNFPAPREAFALYFTGPWFSYHGDAETRCMAHFPVAASCRSRAQEAQVLPETLAGAAAGGYHHAGAAAGNLLRLAGNRADAPGCRRI